MSKTGNEKCISVHFYAELCQADARCQQKLSFLISKISMKIFLIVFLSEKTNHKIKRLTIYSV